MVNRKISIFYLAVMISAIITACGSAKNVTEFPASATSTIQLVIPTSTIVPLTSTIIPAIATATPSAAVIAVPSLSKEDAYQALVSLLKDDRGCQLPCWWEMVPGKSSLVDGYVNLMAFRNIAESKFLYPVGGKIYLTYPKNDLLVDINIGIHPDSDKKIIKALTIFTQVRHEVGNTNHDGLYGASAYIQMFGAYSLQSILSKYGIPSQVLVRADVYDYSSDPDTFEITLLYPEKGIFVRYDALGERVGSKIQGCPSKAFMELWLLNPDSKDSYHKILSSMDETWEENFPYSKPVNEVTEMTLDDFYKTFKTQTNRCLETSLSIWPGH